jgi:hypothetical protein
MSAIAEWLDAVGAWAWDRHHNLLSWYIRPLFLLPFCWFAYRRNLWGIGATLVALATSMAWFPAPEHPDPAVIAMLESEREYLWTFLFGEESGALAHLLPAVLGLAIVNAGVLGVGWLIRRRRPTPAGSVA